MAIGVYVAAGLILAGAVVWMVLHQRALRRRAELMQEAVRNRDFTFRLPTDGLLAGERAIQETLNQLGSIIKEQVNRNEVEAWERLTRVLTHEIMNAVAPIASISQSLLGRADVQGTPLEEAVGAIHTASDHLKTFIDSYRKLSQLQQPVMDRVELQAVAAEAGALFPQLEKHYEQGKTAVPTVWGDATMLRQVMVNLMKNAAEAGATRLYMCADGPHLYVGNDGRPIPAGERSSVFVPFFTTKQHGSGVGLALSRRMMVQQGGMLELADKPLGGCHVTFVLTLSVSASAT